MPPENHHIGCSRGSIVISLALSNRTSITVPAPTSLTATLNSNGSITLSRNAPNDGSVTRYQVLRRRLQKGESALTVYVSDTGSTATTCTDTGTDVNGGGKVDHVGGLVADSPSSTSCRRP